MVIHPRIRSIIVGLTIAYSYFIGIVVFGFFSLGAPLGEPYRDLKHFLAIPMKLGLYASGLIFFALWFLIFLKWLVSKGRHYHSLLKIAIKFISSTGFVLMANIWATYLSLFILAASIQAKSIEWGIKPTLGVPSGSILLCLSALFCGFSVFVYVWSRKVTNPAILQLEKMIADTCGKCGYLLFDNKAICTECGWGRTSKDIEPTKQSA